MSQSKIQNHKSKIVIASREDADRCLQRIGQLELAIEEAERSAQEEIDAIREQLVSETEPVRDALAQNEAALKLWAKDDRKSWVAKHLELNFGTLGFRRPTPAIKLKLALENIVERLRAKKMHTCIRTVEEVDKEALANYDDETLLDVGCERTKPKDKFWYECKKEEIAR